jgi:chromosome segregation ATPase
MAYSTHKKRSAVTYQEIVAAYEQLLAEGKLPSVRNIKTIVGGCHSTIKAGIEKYKAELEEKSKIPDEAKETLHALGQQLVGLIRKENESTNSKLQTTIDELNQTIASLNDEIEQLEVRSADDREGYRTSIESKEKQLAVASDREQRATDEMKTMQAVLEKERECRHKAEIKIAALEAELKILKSQ